MKTGRFQPVMVAGSSSPSSTSVAIACVVGWGARRK
jgi:hypothetical protein